MKQRTNKEKEEGAIRDYYRKALPFGYKTIVANRLELSRNSICNYLNGSTNNPRIENEILKVLAELKSEKKKNLKAAGLL
jgi:hypothetical protein